MAILRTFLSLLLSMSLAAGTVTISTEAAARGPALVSLGALDGAALDEPAAVLGLDSQDSEAAAALTEALRKAFAERGLGSGQEISLVELRLTMGCDNDEPSCLAEGGKTLGVRRLVYGYLEPSGRDYQVEVRMLDVEQGVVEGEATLPVTKADLAKDKIDATAQTIVNSLMPADEEAEPIATESGSTTTTPDDTAPPIEDKPPKQRKIWFGLEKPTPAWKWAGFGVSLGLAVASAGALIGLNVALKNTQEDLRQAAFDSLDDDKPSNDVDPNMNDPATGRPIDLCEVARREPPGEPGTVTNAAVTEVCNRGDGLSAGSIAAGVGLGVFAVSTLVFTGLLFIHKRSPTADAMLRRGLTVGARPTRDGFVVGGGIRF